MTSHHASWELVRRDYRPAGSFARSSSNQLTMTLMVVGAGGVESSSVAQISRRPSGVASKPDTDALVVS